MALNINISNQNKQRLFDNSVGRKYSIASGISYIVQNDKFPKINHSVSLEFPKERFWKEIKDWTDSPPNNNKLIHMATADKFCHLSIFPNYSRILLNIPSKDRMEVFNRGENDTLKKTIGSLTKSTSGAENRLLVAVNSAYFTVPSPEYYTKYVPGSFINYSTIKPNGKIIHNGASFNSNFLPSPLGFHILYTFNSQPPSSFIFGQGDAPTGNSGDGVGALTPILIYNSTYNKVWKYGNKNVYESGQSGPESGDPGESAPYIITRKNLQYEKQNESGREREGKNIIAYCENKDVVLLITVPHNSTGKNLDYYRNHLFRLGFENAVALDGSTSVTKYLYSNKKYYASPDERKNNSVPLGFIFYV